MSSHPAPRSRAFRFGLLALLVGLLASFLIREKLRSPRSDTSVPAPAPPPASASPEPQTSAAPSATPRSAESPAKPRRNFGDVQKSLMEQAERTLAEGLGGLDEASKAQLKQRIEALKSLAARGLGERHPVVIPQLASFSKFLDELGAYQEAAANREIADYLDQLIKDLDASEAPPAELLEKWGRELDRDDGFQAVLLMGLSERDKAFLRKTLEQRRQNFTR